MNTFAIALTLCVTTLSLSLTPGTAKDAPDSKNTPEKKDAAVKQDTGDNKPAAKTTKLFGQINSFGSACLSAGITPESTQLPTLIQSVRMGTPAYSAGVASGDKILAAKLGNNVLQIRIERNGRMYELSLRARTDVQLDSSRLSAGTAKLSGDVFDKLKNYRVSYIIDRSGSMSRPLGNTNKSIWSWVKTEFSKFADQAESANHQPFDLVLFNDKCQVEIAKTAAKIRALLDETVTTSDTNINAALATYLSQVDVQNSRPLLLLVVTDGKSVKTASQELRATLTANARKAGKAGIRIIFIQTGYSEEGMQFASELSSELKAGGLTGFARAVDFSAVERGGVSGLLAPLL